MTLISCSPYAIQISFLFFRAKSIEELVQLNIYYIGYFLRSRMDSVYIDYRYYYESSNLDQLYIDRSLFIYYYLLRKYENTSSTENNIANERRNLKKFMVYFFGTKLRASPSLPNSADDCRV